MTININKSLVCSKCNSKDFQMKREATYLYTYNINSSDNKAFTDKDEMLPFLFERREQINEKEYLICKECGNSYPCSLDEENKQIQLTILQKAIRADHQKKPEFLG